jgi:large subunit ribosomal protein L10
MGNAPKPSGFRTTKDGKAGVIARTKELIQKSSMIISVPFEGVTKENTDILRKSLPQGVPASMVKNALMRKSVEGTDFAALTSNLKHESLFFFVPEGQAKPVYDAFKKWQKEIKRIEPEYEARVLATEGQAYVGKQLEYVVSLPSKLELITKVAIGIKATPTRLARAIKAVPNKVGRAFGALKTKLEEGGGVGVGAAEVGTAVMAA